MSFAAYETSRERGAPVELYMFDYPGGGPSQTYRYTNAVRDIAFGGGTFKKIPISRDNMKTDGKFDKSQLNVNVPVTTELAALFLPYPPPGVVRCRIWQGHLSDPEHAFKVVWHGRVLSVAREQDEAKLTCDSTILSYKRRGLHRFYQHGCPLPLYGQRCRANKANFRYPVVIESVDASTIHLPTGWNQGRAPKAFVGGTFEWDSQYGHEVRMIIRATATSLTMAGYIRDLEANDHADLYLGCGHNMTACKDVFNNIVNYGGQPWIPFKNPTKQHPYW